MIFDLFDNIRIFRIFFQNFLEIGFGFFEVLEGDVRLAAAIEALGVAGLELKHRIALLQGAFILIHPEMKYVRYINF